MTTENLYDSIALAENIKIQAKARNIQLKDMYAELGMSKGVLSNLRTGRMIAADSLARIADYLDCSMDFLMGRTVDPAVQRMELTDEERQKVTDFLQFILSSGNMLRAAPMALFCCFLFFRREICRPIGYAAPNRFSVDICSIL